ncbi:YpmS family protein [Aureibacillus halotolerans]|uniref:Uncharacterized protein YpmS n=1 Tax=Aureibacillus halotolerans TaxID=1508390 RepID=A0A4R6U1X1_9BACI|nr:YpmS family protein [Aureibacillus halotolerans]TDQ40330.1 uncharacterized protein YpmS [Aureibacillus halotolerans]
MKSLNKKSLWKWLFIALAGVNVAIVAFLIWAIFGPITVPHDTSASPVAERDSYPFTIEASKTDLNEVIDTFLEEQTKNAIIPYTIRLEEKDVRLYGSIKAFGQDVDLLLAFTPKVLPNGDLELHQSRLQVGELPLPVKTVLEYVQRHYALPDWVTIRPKDKVVTVELTEFTSTGGVSFEVKNFDLPNNQIKIEIKVPRKLIQEQS